MAKSKTVKAPAEEAKIEKKIPVVKNLRDGGNTPSFDGIARPFTLFFGEATLTCPGCTVTEVEDPETGETMLVVQMPVNLNCPGYALGEGYAEINLYKEYV